MKLTISKSKIKALLTVISVLTFITSCKKNGCEDVEGNLTSEEQSWLSYSGGEMLIFQRDTTLIDTFWVGNKISFYNAGYVESEDPCQHHQQQEEFNITDSSSRTFNITVTHNNRWVHGGAGIATVGTSSEFIFANYSPQNNILLHGQTYNSVYIMTIDTTNLSSSEIWRIYYTKQNGILRYDFVQGHYWERIN